MIMTDLCCTAETTKHCKAIFLQIKNKKKKSRPMIIKFFVMKLKDACSLEDKL